MELAERAHSLGFTQFVYGEKTFKITLYSGLMLPETGEHDFN